jgi:hypothetical protein
MNKLTVLFVSIAILWPCTAMAALDPSERETLAKTAREYNEKGSLRIAQKNEEARGIDVKLQALTAKLATADEDTKLKIQDQVRQLTQRRNAVYLEIAEFSVEFAKKNLEFAQKRVAMAEHNLAELTALAQSGGAEPQPQVIALTPEA